jgi:hypothetical protein
MKSESDQLITALVSMLMALIIVCVLAAFLLRYLADETEPPETVIACVKPVLVPADGKYRIRMIRCDETKEIPNPDHDEWKRRQEK